MSSPSARPRSVWVASGLTAVAVGALLAVAVGTVVANPDALSFGIAAVLVLWAAVCAWGAWGMYSGRSWSRGPVVAAALMHTASCAGFVHSQPWALLPTLGAVVTVWSAVRPDTARYLRLTDPD